MAAKGQPQPIDEAENFPKQFPRHRNLGQLQSDIAAVAHDLGANLAPYNRRLIASAVCLFVATNAGTEVTEI